METFQQQLAARLAQAVAKAGFAEAGELSPATDARFGDYQATTALVLGKQRGENPREIANKIIEHVDVSDLAEPPQTAGAGFINFTLRREAVEKKLAELLPDERLGVARSTSPRKIVIDFGSPNIAKPMHVGHIRSTVLGDALARIATFLGHDVIRDNHIGDWGTQFGIVIWAWKNLLDRDALRRNALAEIVRIYKEANLRSTTDPEVRDACREELVKLQAGDAENLDIWKQCVASSMQEFDAIYELLDVRYDVQLGESFYNERLAEIVDRLLKRGIAEISEGAVVVFFRDVCELRDKPCIIRKRDGGYNYATTDIATVEHRVGELKRDTLWYVVGAPQILHFKQIFEIARRAGYTADFRHITFGSILGEDRKLMKTRSGENVPLRELLDEACRRAREIVEQKNPTLSEYDKIEIAEKIGIGAIKYAELSQYRMTDYVFAWNKLLSLQGNTAPYLQNAYVRIRSIFRRSDEHWRAEAVDRLTLSEPAEIALAKRLCQFGEVVPQVLNDFRANLLASYLFDVANRFHAFYEACPVLKAAEPARSSRLAVCELSARVLERGLNLLGIQVPERM